MERWEGKWGQRGNRAAAKGRRTRRWGAAAEGLGRAEKPPTQPGAGAGAGGRLGPGSPGASALSCRGFIYLRAPPGAGGCGRKRLACAGRPAAGAPLRTPALPAPRLRPPAPQPAEHGARRGRCDGADGAREPARGSVARGTHPRPPPHPRVRGLWVAGGGMLGRAAGRKSYSPYSAGRRSTGKADSPRRSLDSLPHAPAVRLTVRPGAPRGCWGGGPGVSRAAAPQGGRGRVFKG